MKLPKLKLLAHVTGSKIEETPATRTPVIMARSKRYADLWATFFQVSDYFYLAEKMDVQGLSESRHTLIRIEDFWRSPAYSESLLSSRLPNWKSSPIYSLRCCGWVQIDRPDPAFWGDRNIT